jgi:hypothetical protein
MGSENVVFLGGFLATVSVVLAETVVDVSGVLGVTMISTWDPSVWEINQRRKLKCSPKVTG